MSSNEGFSEDVSRKARWFYETRGKQSGAEANRRWREALAQVEVLRASRLADRDPGGEPLTEAFRLSGGGGRKRKAKVVHNPRPAASNGFATACVDVRIDSTGGRPALLKIQMLRGAGRRLLLSTTKVFMWDERLRRWHMVDQSGYSPASRCAWALVSRSGVFAAIAFPAEKKAARALGLERFAYYYTQLGVESGLTPRVADYFDSTIFRQLISMDPGMPQSPAAATRHTRALASLHGESKVFRQSWRGQLPNGGLPEWHMIEHFASVRPDLLTHIGVDDIVHQFPWIFRVANRVGRWHPNGPDNVSGRVKSLAIHPTNGDVLYAGAANGGVWKSTDGGSVWRSLWTFQGSMAVGSIAIAPSAPNTIYAATGEDTPNAGASYGGVGVYKSTDEGATWVLKTNPVLGALCTRIIVHPADPKVVYLATESGVHKTTDGGDNWTRILKGHASDLVMAHDRPDILYAGVWNDGLYKTANGGGSWVRNTSDVSGLPFPTGTGAGWIKLAIGQSGPHGSDFVIAKLGENGGYTFATFNGGAAWGLAGGSEPAVLPNGNEYDTWTSMVAIHPKNDRRLYLGGVNLQYSDDGFFFHPATGTHLDHHQVVFDPNNEAICYCCCDGGVFRSQDFGVTWQAASRFLQATQLISLGVSHMGNFVVGSATQDQGIIQTDGSTEWQDFNGGNEWGMFVVDPNDSDNIYISPGPDDQLRRSSDGGHNWTDPTRGLTDPWASQMRDTKPATFAHVAVRPGFSNFLIGGAFVFEQVKNDAGKVDTYGPFSRLYYSRDWGQSWWSAHSVPSKITWVAYAPTDASRAYAGSESGAFYRSDHGGEPAWFEPATGADKPPLGMIMSVTVDPTQADTVYITYGSNVYPNVYRSTDGGAHWASVAGDFEDMALPKLTVSALVVDAESRDILYAGTDIGVFRSNDFGISWYPYNDTPDDDDLPQVIVTGLANQGTQLFASTFGRGLYTTFTSAIVSLQVLAVSYLFRNRLHQGIQWLRLTDGKTIYIMTRTEVIRRIEAGTDVYTVGKDGSRAEVVVMEPDREHPILYLKTVTDFITADNLISLPRF